MLKSLPAPGVFGVEKICAFEDHAFFVYLFGMSTHFTQQDVKAPGKPEPGVLRRLFLIRPDILIIDDQVTQGFATEVVWMSDAPVSLGRAYHDERKSDPDGQHYRIQCVLAESMKDVSAKDTNAWNELPQTTRLRPSEASSKMRVVHVVSLANKEPAALPNCSAERKDGTVYVKIADSVDGTESPRVIHLWVPDGSASGRIEIERGNAGKYVSNRLLPAGVLPPGVEAAQRRLQWDRPYRAEGMATWDTQRPSSELQRVVESGRVKPGRTIEIGCGTGNDAIYLASLGFDVTAIDISPTALNIAERKAQKVGVEVEWLLADILQPPSLEKFSFVYDRGCYHEVRQHYADDYLAAVRKLARDGSKILILAGNANKDSYWRFHGPPRVKEQDIYKEFATGFRLLQLREFRFDPAPPDREGALAWSILLERVAGARIGGVPR
jgi:SAM-dependent methyltransferase